MRWGLLLVLAGMLPAVAAAAPLTINSPAAETYTEDPAVFIDIETDGDYRLRNYTVVGTDCARQFSGDRTTATNSCTLEDGDHRLTAAATLHNKTVQEHVSFTVDTTPPAVTAEGPPDVVLGSLHPQIAFTVDDTSAVADLTVTLDGTPLENVTAATGLTAVRPGNLSAGNHTVTVNVSDAHGHRTVTSWRFRIPAAPVVSGGVPDRVVGERPTVTAQAAAPGGLAGARLTLARGGETIVTRRMDAEGSDGTWTLFAARGDVADGTYRATVNVTDRRDRWRTRTWTFTVDTGSPTVETVSHTAGDVVTGGERFEVAAADATSRVVKVNLSLGGAATVAAPRPGDRYWATIETAAADGGRIPLVVQAVDAAGNVGTGQTPLVVDNAAPTVQDLAVFPDPSAGVVSITGTAVDETTSVENVSYRVIGANMSGLMHAADGAYGDADEQVRRLLDGVPDGDHTVELVAADAAGHRSGAVQEQVTVDRSLATAFRIDTPSPPRVVVGDTVTVPVHVANTGAVGDIVTVAARSDLDVAVGRPERRLDTRSRKQFPLSVAVPADTAAGMHTVTVTVDGLTGNATRTMDVVVQPPPAEQQALREEVARLEDRFGRMRNNTRSYVVAEQPTVQRSFNETAAAFDRIDRLLADGRYAAAAELLPAVEERMAMSRASATGAMTQHQVRTLSSLLLRLLALAAVIAVVYGAYRFVPPEGGYDTEAGFVHRPDGKHPLRLHAEDRERRLRAAWDAWQEEGR